MIDTQSAKLNPTNNHSNQSISELFKILLTLKFS